jgi:hypothetical protein
MAGVPGRFASQMARLATIHGPPILRSLCLLVATISLAPRPRSELVEHYVEVTQARPPGPIGPLSFYGDPRIIIGFEATHDHMVWRPPAIDPQIRLILTPPIALTDLGLDDVLSGFLGLLTTPEPPHC